MDTTKLIAELDAIATRIANLRSELTGTAPKLNDQAQQRAAAKQCTYCGLPLGKKKPNRGAHEACYRKAMRHVERGWTTDAKLVSDGLLLPQKRQGRKVAEDDPVLKQIREEAEGKAEESTQVAKKRGSKSQEAK